MELRTVVVHDFEDGSPSIHLNVSDDSEDPMWIGQVGDLRERETPGLRIGQLPRERWKSTYLSVYFDMDQRFYHISVLTQYMEVIAMA